MDCAAAESFYGLNDNIGTVPESDPGSEGGYNSPAGAASSPVGYAAPSESYDEPPASTSAQTYSSPSEDSYSAPVSEYQQAGAAGAAGGAGGVRTGRRGGRLLRRPVGSRQGVRRAKTRTDQRKTPRRPAAALGSQTASVKKVQSSGVGRTSKSLRTRNKKKKSGRKTSGRNGRQEPLTSYLPPAAEEPVGGYLPPATEPAPVVEQEESLAQYDYEYEEAPLPTYNSPAASASSSYASGGGEVVEDVSSLADEVYLEDELPTYNNGVYSEGGEGEEGGRYTAPVVDSIPSDSQLEEGDALPTYNNGVYNSAQSEEPEEPEEYDYQDELPSYNNGVYSEGDSTGSRYTAPEAPANSYSQPSAAAAAPLSYGAPESPPSPTFSPSPSYGSSFQPISAPAPPPPPPAYDSPSGPSGPSTSIYDAPVPGSYQDPTADILPEYHKSEISLRLNNRNEVPRIEPFQTDFGEPLYIGTYKASGSAPRPAVVPPPSSARSDSVPLVSLSKYNIPEVSDKGFKGLGSSYGR